MPGGQRAWPHDRILALYWYLRLDPVSGRIVDHEQVGTRMRKSGCTRILAFLCDIGTALASLPGSQRAMIESRWSAWDRAAYCSGRVQYLRCEKRRELSTSSVAARELEQAIEEWRFLRAHYREHQRRVEATQLYRTAQSRLSDELMARDLTARAVDRRLGLTLLGDRNLPLDELGALALERLNLAVAEAERSA